MTTTTPSYPHTLTARPYNFPTTRDPLLPLILTHFMTFPPEIRRQIFIHAFRGNRVAVTSSSACYCATSSTGPYRADHQFLLKKSTPAEVRNEATRVFVQVAMWEIHCERALRDFVARMNMLGLIGEVRHLRVLVNEIDPGQNLDVEKSVVGNFPNLKSVTLAPWQKEWNVVMPYALDSAELSDGNVLARLGKVLERKEAYREVEELRRKGVRERGWRMFFAFAIRFYAGREEDEEGRGVGLGEERWQLRVWRADLDGGKVERGWSEVYVVQEATLD